MPTITEIITACPACGSEVWDNRANKKNPKGPDWKCKNETCTERAYWLAAPKTAALKPATPKPAAPTGTINWAAVQRDAAALIYTAAHALATGLKCEIGDVDQRAVAAQAATLLIQLEKQGHKLGTLAPKKPAAPKAPPPPTPEELAEVPEALRDETGSDLPF